MKRALPLLLLLLAACQRPTDGRWRAETIDGVAVGERDYWIRVEGRKAVAGKDGCNGWARSLRDPNSVESDCMGCPPDPLRDAYWAVVHPAAPEPRLDGEGRLVARSKGHVAVFRRDAAGS